MNTTHIGSLPKKRGGGVGGEEEAMSRRKEKEKRKRKRKKKKKKKKSNVELHKGNFCLKIMSNFSLQISLHFGEKTFW